MTPLLTIVLVCGVQLSYLDEFDLQYPSHPVQFGGKRHPLVLPATIPQHCPEVNCSSTPHFPTHWYFTKRGDIVAPYWASWSGNITCTCLRWGVELPLRTCSLTVTPLQSEREAQEHGRGSGQRPKQEHNATENSALVAHHHLRGLLQLHSTTDGQMSKKDRTPVGVRVGRWFSLIAFVFLFTGTIWLR
eukprot:TRINITY_DN94021_c0_g1_i1.p1 TRINITY_DN94021_c0_g1~~TRINITY_DN94021_c0_g1_i1.p1  ORF type:complete len:189 (+),score=0.36 TRINITY_DN94021_c0_g1_i1:190-756(+)